MILRAFLNDEHNRCCRFFHKFNNVAQFSVAVNKNVADLDITAWFCKLQPRIVHVDHYHRLCSKLL